MKHPETIEKYQGSMEELAVDLANLRYDALANLLRGVAKKLNEDGVKDWNAGRTQLGMSLFAMGNWLIDGAKAVDHLWKICEPHMKDDKLT